MISEIYFKALAITIFNFLGMILSELLLLNFDRHQKVSHFVFKFLHLGGNRSLNFPLC